MMENLKWTYEMGADEAVGDKAINRYEKVKQDMAVKEVVKKIVQPGNNAPVANPIEAANSTKKIASACNTLEQLSTAVRSFNDLSICKTATHTVFADGNPDAEIMLIGEAPGAEEDAQGIPFCGASGKMLDQMLSHIGLVRANNFYITNTLFWRPPGNRRPTPEELAICRPFVEKHIALIKPKLIVLVGGTAIVSVLQSKEGISKLRGNFYDYNSEYLDAPIKTTAIFHPSYWLRSPGQKRFAWKDALMLKHYLIDNKIKF